LGKTAQHPSFRPTVSDTDPYPEDPLTYDEAAPSPREKAMGFFDHLEDLRWTLVKCVVAFLICAGLIGYFLQEFNSLLLWPLHKVQAEYPKQVIDLGTVSIMEGFTVVIQMCVLGGLVLSAPFMLFFIGRFVSPALTQRELKMVLPICFAALGLFLCGSVFSYYLLVPSTLRVSVEINEMFGFVMRWTPGSYYSLLMWLVLGVGASFEFPLLIVLLVYMGVMTTAFLRKYRRHAIVVIFLIAAVVTPTPDPFTQTLFAAPLYVLYEIAIIAGRRIEKRRAAA
jgi:sec-independent protein translocase protein TatC